MTQSDFLKSIRQYFWSKNFTEVEIPYLNSSLPLEPNIFSFKTNWRHKNIDYFLPTSPELALKKYLLENKQDCFAISHCFRDLEDSNDTHTPEFLMLEWYEINKNLNELKISTKNFIKQFLPKIEFIELVLEKTNIDNEPDFNQYFLNEIESKLPKNRAVFITGYPAFLSPLSKFDEVNNFSERSERDQAYASPEGSEHRKNSFTSQIANRFELYINGIEIANGCEENTDSTSIKKAFEEQQTYRQENNLPTHPYSLEFVKISTNLPQSSGIGIGIDRLLNVININEPRSTNTKYTTKSAKPHSTKRQQDYT